MKLKPGFRLYDVCGEKVIIAEGIENINFSYMVNLNETAAHLWAYAEAHTPFTIDELAAHLTNTYDVDPHTAHTDVNSMIQEWKKLGLVEE